MTNLCTQGRSTSSLYSDDLGVRAPIAPLAEMPQIIDLHDVHKNQYRLIIIIIPSDIRSAPALVCSNLSNNSCPSYLSGEPHHLSQTKHTLQTIRRCLFLFCVSV